MDKVQGGARRGPEPVRKSPAKPQASPAPAAKTAPLTSNDQLKLPGTKATSLDRLEVVASVKGPKATMAGVKGGSQSGSMDEVLNAPGVTPEIRKHLADALEQDDFDAENSLITAMSRLKTPADVEALFKVREASGVGSTEWMIQVMADNFRLDPKLMLPTQPNRDLMQALSDACQESGLPDHAKAFRYLSDPRVSSEVRTPLLDALRDDNDTAFELLEALAWAESEVEGLATQSTGDATVGEEHMDQITAMGAVQKAQGAYNQEMEKLAELNGALQRGIAMLEGRPKGEVEDFVESFMKDHEEAYKPLNQKAIEVAEALAAHQDTIAAALSRGEPLEGIATDELERAMEIASHTPNGHATVVNLSTKLLEQSETVPPERLTWLTEQVLPGVMRKELELAVNDGDPAKALQAFKTTDLYQAMAGMSKDAPAWKSVDAALTGIDQLSDAYGRKDDQAVAKTIKSLAESGPLGRELAGAGLVLGAMGAKDPGKLMDSVATMLDASSVGIDVLESAGRMFNGVGDKLAKLGKAGGVLSALGGAAAGLGALARGDELGAGLEGVGVVASLMAAGGSGPAAVVAVAVTAGIFIRNMINEAEVKERQDNLIRAQLENMGLEEGLQDFLISSKAGAYQEVKENLGLTDGEIERLVKDGSAWTRDLDELARIPGLGKTLKNLSPTGDAASVIHRLGQGLKPGLDVNPDVSGAGLIVQYLPYVLYPSIDPQTRLPLTTSEKLEKAPQSTLPSQYLGQAQENLVSVFSVLSSGKE